MNADLSRDLICGSKHQYSTNCYGIPIEIKLIKKDIKLKGEDDAIKYFGGYGPYKYEGKKYYIIKYNDNAIVIGPNIKYNYNCNINKTEEKLSEGTFIFKKKDIVPSELESNVFHIVKLSNVELDSSVANRIANACFNLDVRPFITLDTVYYVYSYDPKRGYYRTSYFYIPKKFVLKYGRVMPDIVAYNPFKKTNIYFLCKIGNDYYMVWAYDEELLMYFKVTGEKIIVSTTEFIKNYLTQDGYVSLYKILKEYNGIYSEIDKNPFISDVYLKIVSSKYTFKKGEKSVSYVVSKNEGFDTLYVDTGYVEYIYKVVPYLKLKDYKVPVNDSYVKSIEFKPNGIAKPYPSDVISITNIGGNRYNISFNTKLPYGLDKRYFIAQYYINIETKSDKFRIDKSYMRINTNKKLNNPQLYVEPSNCMNILVTNNAQFGRYVGSGYIDTNGRACHVFRAEFLNCENMYYITVHKIIKPYVKINQTKIEFDNKDPAIGSISTIIDDKLTVILPEQITTLYTNECLEKLTCFGGSIRYVVPVELYMPASKKMCAGFIVNELSGVDQDKLINLINNAGVSKGILVLK